MSVLCVSAGDKAEDVGEVSGGPVDPGLFWTRTRSTVHAVPHLTRVVIALDPAGTSQAPADEMGIVAGGVALTAMATCCGMPRGGARRKPVPCRHSPV